MPRGLRGTRRRRAIADTPQEAGGGRPSAWRGGAVGRPNLLHSAPERAAQLLQIATDGSWERAGGADLQELCTGSGHNPLGIRRLFGVH